ncbi:MAG: DUF2760 domain-containing protein [Desulfobacterales bacterium]|nr:DUF2760 domain-containing protein [Desulfobacterales bacterium]
MDMIKAFSRRSIFITIFFMLVLSIVVDGIFYLCLNFLSEKVTALTQSSPEITALNEFLNWVVMIQDMFIFYFLPISTCVFIFFGLLLWLFSRLSLARVIRKSDYAEVKNQKGLVDVTPLKKKERENNDRRLFLHLLSVFQREGRLLDFFSEDLSPYEDSQIGAAVRNIHESCKKVVSKYLAPQPITDENEGEQIAVEGDFDPNLIKLTGNVTGNPPFKGIVRHRGWKIKRFDLPTLSSSQDASIIAPAEIEIV